MNKEERRVDEVRKSDVSQSLVDVVTCRNVSNLSVSNLSDRIWEKLWFKILDSIF